jgi:hypothetical protein
MLAVSASDEEEALLLLLLLLMQHRTQQLQYAVSIASFNCV